MKNKTFWIAETTGMIALLAFMAFVTFKDIWKLFA